MFGFDAASFTTGSDDVPEVQNNSANHRPTSSSSKVTTPRDTDYTFKVTDFNFMDDDAGDVLENVVITSRPRPDRGEGTLMLDDTAIAQSRLPLTVSMAKLADGDLTYSPPAGEGGADFATFRFKVNDGAVDSESADTMTIDVGQTTALQVVSIERWDPSSSPTNSDILTWRVTFSKDVANVDAADFGVTGTTATLAASADANVADVWDVTASGGDLASRNNTVTLSFAAGQNIQDTAGNALSDTEPTAANDDYYVVDNTAPTAPAYTEPSLLQVGETITEMSPGGGVGIDEYGAPGLPSGLAIDAASGVISGMPDSAGASATVTVTVSDAAGNTDTVDIEFPAVDKGDQTLTGFAYDSMSVLFGADAPAVMPPAGAVTALSYSTTSQTCTVTALTGALTELAVGDCVVTVTAEGTANYNKASATFTVTVQAAGVLVLNVNPIATDDTINIAEKAAGFAIAGDTGSEAGVDVMVTVGAETLTATSAAAGGWSVDVPGDASYITATSVALEVTAEKAGFTSPSAVQRSLAVDLTAPAAPSYTEPVSLQVGVPITMSPGGGSDIDEYGALSLPSGLAIDAGTGAITGTPNTAHASPSGARVTVSDAADNTAAVNLVFPAVDKGDQTLSGFAYSPASVAFGSTAPTPTEPSGAQTTLSYSVSEESVSVCSVDPNTGELTINEVGACAVTATAAGSANYNEARVTVTVTVNPQETAGICGRTEQVRDELLDLIEVNEGSAVTCADVTDAHLAAITGELDLNNQSITALAAGDFDGLTALEILYLYYNALTTLPAGVFDKLTALKTLDLDFNGLTTLPDGVFDKLTALDQLFLEDNGLDTLPAGVFDGLTALTKLTLLGNPGAPFSPEAVARSDDETVPDTGGMVRLDGSGSNGGPWGTNVTYGWALTAPASGVSVTFDDDTSVTPQVTVPALPADTEQLTFTLTVTGRGGTSGIAPATATVTVTVTEDLRPYVTLASPNAYHLETLGLDANEATGRPVTLVVVFSAEVTGLQAEEFVIENGEVTDVYWVNCLLRNPSRERWCIVMQPDDAPGERMTLTIPENIADGGNQPAPEVYYAVLRGTAPTGTFTTAAVEPVSRDFLARLTFDQDMLEDAPGTETLMFPEEEYLKSLDFQVPVEAVARITDFTHADDGSTIQVRIYPPGLLYQEPMSVVLPADAALSEAGYPNPELKLEVLVDTFTGSTLEALALTDLEFSPALDFATIRDHAASVGNEVVATEVTATPTVAGAIVNIEPPDADPDTVGHQVALDVGDTTVTVTVKDANSPDLVTGGSVNKSWQQTYEVVITRAPAKVSLARTGDVQNVEEGEPAPFTLTRIGDQTQPLEVFVEVEGAEWLSPGNWPTQVTIPIGATVHEFTVETNDDDAERENGAITVRVLAGSEYEVTDADAGEASIEINDNDTRSLVLSRSSLEVPEAGSANYTVKLVSEPSADVTVDITGHSDTDLTLDPASASLTFTTTNWATAQTVVVSAAQDSDATHDRATLTHTASGGGYDSVTRDLEVAVTDTTRVQLAAVVEDVPEGGSRPIRAMLPMPLDEDVTITVAVVPNDGTDGGRADEYELSANTTLTIAAGTTESTGAVIFTSLDDSDYTGTRLFDATLTPGHPRVDADTAEIAVVDDDNTIIGWIVNPSTIFENGGEATLRAFKTELNQGVVKMALSLQPSDRAVLSGTTLTFQPGAIYAAETLIITAVDNAADEPDQTITILATVTEGRGVRTPEPQELTIVDDDNMSPDVALVLTPSQVRESLVSTVTAVASGPLDDEATITVSASPGHADTRTDDYVLSANTVLTIPAGGTRSTQTVTIASVDDPLSGGSRTREVTVSGTVTGGGGAADPDDRTLTILEDDRQVLLDLVATPATITEGEVSTITLHAFQPVPADVTVTVEHSNDAAELSANPVLMIAAGQTDSTGVVTLTALQDADIRTEIVELRGTPSDDSQFVSVNYGAQVIIIDDDDMRDVQVSVTPAPTQVFEGGTSTFTANLNQPLSDEVTITVGVDEAHPDHTAAADHFTLSANRTLTIPAGSMHSTDVVTLTASNDDYYYGPSRTVVLDFSATGIDQKRILDYNTWIILEDEAQPRVTLSVAPASIAENGGQSMVAASLNTIVESDVEVTVTTAPVVAAEADDFTQSATLLTIPAGRKNSTGNVTINAVDDAIDGPDKHFVVQGTVEVVGMEQSGLVWFPVRRGLDDPGRRRGARGAVDLLAGRRRREQQHLHGGAGFAADGGGDDRYHRPLGHGPDAGPGVGDAHVHDVELVGGADGDGGGGPGRRRGGRHGDAGSHGVGRRLRLGDRGPAGNGDRRRHRAGDRGDAHGGRCAAGGGMDGGGQRHRLQGAVEVGRAGLRPRHPAGHGFVGFDHQPPDRQPCQRDGIHGAGDRGPVRGQRRAAVG